MAMEAPFLAKSTLATASVAPATSRRQLQVLRATGSRRVDSAVPSVAPVTGRSQLQVLRATCRRRVGSAMVAAAAIENSGGGSRVGVLSSNYAVPFDRVPTLTRPLEEILRDLNKRVPDNLVKNNSITWFNANRMLSFYAPGWCGEIRDVIYSDHGSVTVVYRVTVRGTDGEVYRESTGTVFRNGGQFEDPVVAAEEIAFCRACARFGLGLHLYHEE